MMHVLRSIVTLPTFKMGQDFVNMRYVVLYQLGKYYKIVLIDERHFQFQGGHYYVHCPLECCWHTFQTDGHLNELIKSTKSSVGRFLTVLLINLYLAVSRVFVESQEDNLLSKYINIFVHYEDWVEFPYSHLDQFPIGHAELQKATFCEQILSE